MKKALLSFLLVELSLLCGCAVTRTAAPTQPAVKEKPALVLPTVPVGKEWQVQERAPDLTDERGHLPFQTEQSLHPEPTPTPTTPSGQKIEPRQ